MKKLKNANGSLSPSDGGVYFTDTSGSGKRRAEFMEKWISTLTNMVARLSLLQLAMINQRLILQVVHSKFMGVS